MSSASSPAPVRSEPSHANGTATPNKQNVELKEMGANAPVQREMPLEEDIMQLARLGEIAAIQKLFDSKKFDAKYKDEQGITPLHWAAINNHYALCHFLIQSGCDVNARGGDAVATPVLWAAKRCNYYVVHLLLQNGADPLLTDDQGFNLLHSATLDGNVFQLVMLLHEDIPVDIPDAQGHTSLMWAAYKGFPACVDLFLRWGANVYARDQQGFTALHWALVKGSQACTQKLIEYGSDRFAENNEGKTPAITAQDMNSVPQWRRALNECGFNPDGTPKPFPLSGIIKDQRTFIWRFFFLWPFFMIFVGLYILSYMVVYAAVPITLIGLYGLQWLAQQALRWAPSDMKHIHKTPYLAGVFAGTLFWVGADYVTAILPRTYLTNPFLNILFIAFYSLCAYFYFFTMTADPGYVPKSGSRTQQKAVIDELLEGRKFDESHFCVQCLVRKPVRSKHCKRCNRCVAKEDHHCPWVDNCVANNNHRQFLLYIITIEAGIITFVRLALSYLEQVPAHSPPPKCNILSDDLCAILDKDPFTIVLTIWATLQLTWVTMLVFVQLVQIARAMTTYEAMKGHHHGHGHGEQPTAGEAITSFVTTGSADPDEAGLTSDGAGPTLSGPQPSAGAAAAPGRPRHAHGRKQKEGCWDQWKRLLGLDTFILTAMHGSNADRVRAQDRRNPFTRGMITNCKDFWCDPRPVFKQSSPGEALLGGEHVDYTKLYEPPLSAMQYRRGGYEGVETDDNV